MSKTIIISGCKYTYDDELYLVVIMSLLQKPYKQDCYYSNALFQKSVGYARKSIGRCRLEMAQIAQQVCPGAVYCRRNDALKKPAGLYDGDRIIYKVGNRQFRHIFHSGCIKPIDEEITSMLHCGNKHAAALLDLLWAKYGVVDKVEVCRMTVGLPRCHYPLIHYDAEHDKTENDYWLERKTQRIIPVPMPRIYNN